MRLSESSRNVGSILIGIILVSGLGYLGWQGERWINWKFGYSKDVSSEVEPLKKEIQELRERIEELERK